MFLVETKNDVTKGLEVEKVRVHFRNSMMTVGGREGFGEPSLKKSVGSDGGGLWNALLRY